MTVLKGRVVGKPPAAPKAPGPMIPGNKRHPGVAPDLSEYEAGVATSGLGEQLAARLLAEQAAKEAVPAPVVTKPAPQPMSVKPPRAAAPTRQTPPMASRPVEQPRPAAPVLEDGVLKDALAATQKARATESSAISEITTRIPQDGYTRIEVPSRCRPYKAKGVTDIFVRPLRIEDAWAIAAAVDANDFTALVDALQPAVVQDLRDLTEPDFTYIRYWLRINSYKRSPYTFRWTSRYGNRLQRVLSMANLETIELRLTAEEVAEYASRGIRFPTVRDVEAISNAKNDTRANVLSLADRAQYVILPPEIEETVAPGEWLQARIEYLKTLPIEFLEEVRDFRDRAAHGVKEYFEAIDDQFVPDKAMSYLLTVAEELADRAANANPNTPEDAVRSILDKVTEFTAEANEIEEKLAANAARKERGEPEEPIVARKEVITVTTTVMDFFPSI